ncbi:hypothetical protein SPRG_02942 [Saprolegnia parasitica CBS 223.65]|uniref:EF-hand domain-containing protein n=1 Tax=Saprolegnia parasitica (strain CBS 223.65) TaxID=695850 RepID=A0A067CT77_SAPPC|nr:hypothetical protein SPRG_02942 [Saprolegnia parasitica CBS 223.65]KDO32465.1 hypothetical protein SPRG_02942 [Saprolegnia parasitica CBS 223.65]|eukprot:XP_012196916.1 hypothetical protein SPRG_02942 [Saprolegnia parasitica CBS 223.65]
MLHGTPGRKRPKDSKYGLSWYKNTFETEGLSINEKGEITASPPTPDVADATDASATVLARHPLVSTPPRTRQHAAAWTRRQEKKLEPLGVRPSPKNSAPTKLLGRMSWDPDVLEIRETSRRGHEPLPPEIAKLQAGSVESRPTSQPVREILKQSALPYQPRAGSTATFTNLPRQSSFFDRSVDRLVASPRVMRMDDHDAEDLLEALESPVRPPLKSSPSFGLTRVNQKKYFGAPARQTFYADYRELAAKQQLYAIPMGTGIDASSRGETKADAKDVASPRTHCLTKSIMAGRPAIPLVIRKNTTNVFDFSYQSLGDAYMEQFAECVGSLPFLEEINVRDNRLSDMGLHRLLTAVHEHLRLRKLDISENTIGSNAAKILRTMIASPSCTLQHLVMAKADIDDFECAAFMSAFEKNASVEELVMPRNRIGEAEQLNVVKPEITTGGEAIASMLYVNEKLAKLDLSWNLLRLESGVTLAHSLEYNRKLLELHIAYNACGDAGAMMFGRVLSLNSTLRVLDLSYNNVGCRGALVLASAASKTKSLRLLLLNGNNIGKEGGRAIMFAMCNNKSDHGIDIEIAGCNLASTGKSEKAMFDPTNPAGEYNLDLSEPFDQMIATELLRLATYKKGCRFEKLKHHSRVERVKNKQQKKTKELRIDSAALQAVFLGLNMRPTLPTLDAILAAMKQLQPPTSAAPSDEFDFSNMFFLALFCVIDADLSGGIDARELQTALQMLDIHMTDHDVINVIAQYDLDSSGTIEGPEFVEFIKSYVRRQSTMSAKDQAFALRDVATNQVWHVPQEGRLEVVFVYEREATFDSDDARHRLSDGGVAQLIKNIQSQAKSSAEKLDLLNMAVHDSEILFTAPQAYELLDQCGGLAKDVRVKEIANLVLQMLTAREAQRLVSMALSLRERAMLKLELGNAYTVIMGNPTAHFSLDLSAPTDRWVARKLVEIAQSEKKASIASRRGDTSQHANWENYRNETLDGQRIVLTTSFFDSLPQAGRLEFDYVSTRRPPPGAQALSDRRYIQLLKELARDTYYVDISEHDKHTATVVSPARARWQKIRDSVRRDRFFNLTTFAQAHIFRIKNSKEEIRLKLIQIEIVTSDRYLTVAQASRIVLSMPIGNFGRVEAARVLFSRLMDVENFVDILDELSVPEQKMLATYLGWLNILNPLKPDRYYVLDMSVLEDYAVAKILVHLAIVEEGDNWVDYSYAPIKNEPPLPNWVLPASWDADDTGKGEGPRRNGILKLRFRSTPEDGCEPDWDARQEMKKRVLCGP